MKVLLKILIYLCATNLVAGFQFKTHACPVENISINSSWKINKGDRDEKNINSNNLDTTFL